MNLRVAVRLSKDKGERVRSGAQLSFLRTARTPRGGDASDEPGAEERRDDTPGITPEGTRPPEGCSSVRTGLAGIPSGCNPYARPPGVSLRSTPG